MEMQNLSPADPPPTTRHSEPIYMERHRNIDCYFGRKSGLQNGLHHLVSFFIHYLTALCHALEE